MLSIFVTIIPTSSLPSLLRRASVLSQAYIVKIIDAAVMQSKMHFRNTKKPGIQYVVIGLRSGFVLGTRAVSVGTRVLKNKKIAKIMFIHTLLYYNPLALLYPQPSCLWLISFAV